MIDCVAFSVPVPPTFPESLFYRNPEPFVWKQIRFAPVYDKGELGMPKVRSYRGETGGFRIMYYGDCLRVSNSLHKYWHDNNYCDFTFSQLLQAIKGLEELFETDSQKWRLTKLEVGVGIAVDRPAWEYVELVDQYKRKILVPQTNSQVICEKKCVMTEYVVKYYDKRLESKKDHGDIGVDILRVEVCLKKRKLAEYVTSVGMLKDSKNLRKLSDLLLETIEKTTFHNDCDSSLIPLDDLEFYYAGKNRAYWKDLRKLDRTRHKNQLAKHKKLSKRVEDNSTAALLHKLISEKLEELMHK